MLTCFTVVACFILQWPLYVVFQIFYFVRRWNFARTNVIFIEENLRWKLENSPTIPFLFKINFTNVFQITAVENILRNKWNFSYITFKSSGYSISTMNLKKQKAYCRNFRYTRVTPLIKVREKSVITWDLELYSTTHIHEPVTKSIVLYPPPLPKKIKKIKKVKCPPQDNYVTITNSG